VIVFSRHGNTFAAGERAVWVGARSDLPLVSEGFSQADRVADHIRENGLAPDAHRHRTLAAHARM
jgi:broad specificity phosphatase PhoE